MHVRVLFASSVAAIALLLNLETTKEDMKIQMKKFKAIKNKNQKKKTAAVSRQIVEPSLDTPNSVAQPLPPYFAKQTCTVNSREAVNDEETALLKYLNAKLTEFVNHLATTYPYHPMAQRAVESWNGEIKMSTRDTGATFMRNTGCMVINPYFQTPDPSQMAPMDRLLTRILHELAHSWSGPHDAAFYDAQRWFLRVATQDLGWKPSVTCRVCCSYPGAVCSKETVCPLCTWIETGCSSGRTWCGDV